MDEEEGDTSIGSISKPDGRATAREDHYAEKQGQAKSVTP